MSFVVSSGMRVAGIEAIDGSACLAHDTAATIEDARRLWKAVGRDNLMIEVPGTAEGVPAIRQLIGEGVDVNITLLFGVGRYADVTTAYIEGLSTFVEHGACLRQSACCVRRAGP